MKMECMIVHNVMPVYIKGMVDKETAALVRSHLTRCTACAVEYKSMKAWHRGNRSSEQEESVAEQKEHPFLQIWKKLRKKPILIGVIVIALLYFFPVYHLVPAYTASYYEKEDLAKLIFIGSFSDRAAVQPILRQANAAFSDWTHTQAENEERYGLLARYAHDRDSYDGRVKFMEHSLELWSAHLGETEGSMWVYYSQEAIDSDGNTVHGSWKCTALWRLEKNAAGEWEVVEIEDAP